MRVLIIGGTRFIGPHVVQLIQHNGHEVTLFHRGETVYPFSIPVNFIKGDRANLTEFRKRFSDLSPEVVIDIIPYSESEANQLIETFQGITKRIVIISSCDVYRAYDRLFKVFTDELISMPLNELSALRDNFYPYRKTITSQTNDWRYYYDKILVENIIRDCSEVNSSILRLPMVYGPGDHSRIYPYLKCMDNNENILLDENKANWRFCRGYVEDIAYAVILAALDNRECNTIYNVGEMSAHSEKEWIQLIGNAAGWKGEIITLPRSELPENLIETSIDYKQDMILDTDLIRNELKYKELYSAEMAMMKSIEWIRCRVD